MPATYKQPTAPASLIEALFGEMPPHVSAKLRQVKEKIESERGRTIDEFELVEILTDTLAANLDAIVTRLKERAAPPAAPASCGLAARQRGAAPGEACTVRDLDRLADIPAEVDADWWCRHVIQEPREVGTMCRLSTAVPRACLARGEGEVESLVHAARTAAEGGRPLGHVLMCGPPDPRKSMLARALAGALGTRLHLAKAGLVRGPLDLVNLLAGLGRHDVLFIEEFHLLPPLVAWALREAIVGFRLSVSFMSGAERRSVQLRLRPFTLIGATTHPGQLPQSFVSRFAHMEYLGVPTAAPSGASPPRSPSA